MLTNFLSKVFLAFIILVSNVSFAQESTIDGYDYTSAEMLEFNSISGTPSTSSVGKAKVYFDPISGKLQCSQDGGAYTDCVGGGGGGSGTVNTGLSGRFSYYPANGTILDDSSVLTTNGTNVGIGTTLPTSRLEIVRNGSTEDPFMVGLVGASGSFLKVSGAGNVGVGSTNPGEKLDVQGTLRTTDFQLSTNPSPGYVLTSNGVGVGTWMPSSGGGGGSATPAGGLNAVQYNSPVGTLAGTESVFSMNGTNVGIGTTNGAALLDVRGNVGINTATVDENLTVGGDIHLSGNVRADGDPYAKKNFYLKIPTPSDLRSSVGGTQDDEVWSMVEFQGNLYIGYYTAIATEVAKVYKWDGETMSLFHTFGTGVNFEFVELAVYKGKLYAGITGQAADSADIYVYDPIADTWTISFTDTGHNGVFKMGNYNGKLYAGFAYGAADADVYEFDGTTWTLSYSATSSRTLVESMVEHDGKLYVGGGGASAGDAFIVSYDGTTWTDVLDGASTTFSSIINLVSYHGKLIAAAKETVSTGPELIIYNDTGTSWSDLKDDDTYTFCHGLAVYNDHLYSGCTTSGSSPSPIFVYDGSNGIAGWKQAFINTGTEQEPFRMIVFNGELLVGYGFDSQEANIWAYREQLGAQYSKTQKVLNSLNPNNSDDNNNLYSNFGNLTQGGNLIVEKNVGIGTIDVSRILTVKDSAAANNLPTLLIKDSSDNTLFSIKNSANADGQGNVGIGSSNPGWPLDVVGNIRLRGASNPAITFGTDFRTFIVTSAQTSGNLSFWSNLTQKLTIPATSGLSGYFTSGNLGVGTTSPNATLSIAKSSTTPLLHVSSSTTGTGDYLKVDNSGNVGISSTAPGQKLDVQGTIRASTDILVGAQSLCQEDGTNCPASAPAAPAGGTGAVQYNNAGTTAGNEAVFSFNGTNVGIGTTDGINGILDVRGNAYFNNNVGIGSVNPGRRLDVNTSTVNIARFISTSASGTGSGTANVQIATDDGAALAMGDKFMTLSFGAARDAVHTISGAGSITMYATEDWTASSTPSRMDFETAVSGTNFTSGRMTINGLNVGIGTTLPNSRFVVIGNVGVGTVKFNQVTAPENGMIVQGNIGIGTDMTSNNSRLSVYGGNVGVGTINPGTELDVQGTTRSGQIIDSGLTADSMVYSNVSKQLGSVTLTTTGTSGAATFSGGTLNIPQYSASGSSQWFTQTSTSDLVGIGTYDKVGIGTTFGTGSSLTVMGGNVGIGTWKPTVALQVIGSLAIGTNTTTNLCTSTGCSANSANTGYSTNQLFANAGNTTGQSINCTANSLTSGQCMNAQSNSATMTGDLIKASYTGNNTGQALNVGIGTLGSGNALRIINQGAGNTVLFEDVITDTTPFVIDNSGNVGIGTTTASAIFSIPSLKSTTGTRYLCIDTVGNVSSSATACSGT